MKTKVPSLCPFHIGRVLLRENHALCTAEDIRVLSGALRARDVKTLCSYTSSLRLSSAVHCLFHDQIRALFSKNSTFCNESNDKVAWQTFLRNERRCRITSRRLDYFFFVQPHRLEEDLAKTLYKAQSLVKRWLGSYDKFLESFPEDVRTTGGATCNKPRAQTSAVEKIRPRLRISPGGVPLLSAYAKYSNKSIKHVVCNYNRIAFVPKNYKTSRTIACEPDGLLPFQLACDAFIKRRLSRVGVNLSDQTRNQALSKHASISGDIVTLDLANASDSLTIPVLEFLLPKQFFEFFMRLRSRCFRSEYGCGSYSKYASMGNGLTFPLETLVFSAIVAAVGADLKGDASVYGDDIIVPSIHYEAVVKTLKFIGFGINPDKTFCEGPFRESCGTNWYRGVDVTPFYWRDPARSRSDLSLVINSLSQRFHYSDGLADIFVTAVTDNRLPLIPPVADMRSGVMVDIATAYRLRKIRYSHEKQVSLIRLLVLDVPAKTERVIPGSDGLRGLTYWLFNRSSERLSSAPVNTGPVTGFSTPRQLGDSINLRCRLHQSVWRPATGLDPRHFWLGTYLK